MVFICMRFKVSARKYVNNNFYVFFPYSPHQKRKLSNAHALCYVYFNRTYVRICINPLMKFVRKHINNHVYCSRSKYTDNNVQSQYKQMYVTLAGKMIIYVCKRCKRSTDKDYKL